MNSQSSQGPKVTDQTCDHSRLKETRRTRREQKILAFENCAYEKNDLLEANLELVCSDLMRMQSNLLNAGDELLSAAPSAAERANNIISLLESTHKNAKALYLLTDFLERRKAAQKKTEFKAISSQPIDQVDPRGLLRQLPTVAVPRKA